MAWLATLTVAFLAVKSPTANDPPKTSWPAHGDYSVSSDPKSGCSLHMAHSQDGQKLLLEFGQSPNNMLTALLLSNDDHLRGVAEARFEIDGVRMFRVKLSPNQDYFVGVMATQIGEDLRIVRAIRDASTPGSRLEFVAGDYRRVIPIEGLREAADDMLACRSLRRT